MRTARFLGLWLLALLKIVGVVGLFALALWQVTRWAAAAQCDPGQPCWTQEAR